VTTIARVAQEAGVGVGTVSRVINGSASVSEATRRRVLDVVAELGYEPNATARALSTGRTRSVGVIAPFFTRPSVIERLRGVAPLLAASGYQLVLFDVELPEHRARVFRSLIGRVDGLLAVTIAPGRADLERLAAAGVPVVLVDHDHPRLPSVTVDDVAGGRMAVDHLLELGHRRIAFVEGPAGLHTSVHRRQGFEEAVAAAGAEAIRLPGGFEFEAGAAAAEALRDDLPDAVLGVNDEVAIGLLTGLRRAAIDVPGRISVAGIDDTRPARLVDLTSVSLPLHELGEMAARVVLEGAPGDIVLPHRLVPRATTRARSGP
jgi:DNA-binding LacI/PurR family transcriptional regulator